jgi:hypothetical protein
VFKRQIFLKQTSIAVAWRLIPLVDVAFIICGHLVGRNKVNFRLCVTRIVALVLCFDELVLTFDHTNGDIAYICIIQISECSLESVIQISHVKAKIANLVLFKVRHFLLQFIELHFID